MVRCFRVKNSYFGNVLLIFLCGYECRDYMVGFYVCCGWCYIEDFKGFVVEEVIDLFFESREDELNKGLCW